MILIIGGAYQGKQACATERFHLSESDWKDGSTCTLEELKSAKAVHHFHHLIRRQLEQEGSVDHLADTLFRENPDLIVVTDEVGYGIVPIDAKERAWREACGRVCTRLAAESRQVIRVCCGIGTRIK